MSGFTRRIAPSSVAGSELVRRSWLRNAPPSALGGDSAAPIPPERIPARVQRAAVLAPVGEVETRPTCPRHIQLPIGTKPGAPIEWLGYCWHQSLINTCSGPWQKFPRRRQPREAAIDHPPIPPAAPGGSGHPSPHVGGTRRSPHRRCRGHKHIRPPAGELRIEREPQHPPDPRSSTFADRSANRSGESTKRPSKTLIRPPFSATNTRPSAANSDRRRVRQPRI